MNTHTKKTDSALHEKKEAPHKKVTENRETTEKKSPETRKPFVKMPKQGKKEDTY